MHFLDSWNSAFSYKIMHFLHAHQRFANGPVQVSGWTEQERRRAGKNATHHPRCNAGRKDARSTRTSSIDDTSVPRPAFPSYTPLYTPPLAEPQEQLLERQWEQLRIGRRRAAQVGASAGASRGAGGEFQ